MTALLSIMKGMEAAMIPSMRSDCGTQGSHSAPGSQLHQPRERVGNSSASSYFSSTDVLLYFHLTFQQRRLHFPYYYIHIVTLYRHL